MLAIRLAIVTLIHVGCLDVDDIPIKVPQNNVIAYNEPFANRLGSNNPAISPSKLDATTELTLYFSFRKHVPREPIKIKGKTSY